MKVKLTSISHVVVETKKVLVELFGGVCVKILWSAGRYAQVACNNHTYLAKLDNNLLELKILY